jgi:hypothetical protein
MAQLPHVEFDSDAQVISIYILDSSSGLPIAATNSVTISLKDLPAGVGRAVQLRKMLVNTRDPVSGNCTPMQAWFLMTPLEPAT